MSDINEKPVEIEETAEKKNKKEKPKKTMK